MQRQEFESTEPVRRARLFRNGRNQTLGIPREFELDADEVLIHRVEGRLIVEPISRTLSLAEVLATLTPLEEDFPSIDDLPPEPEDIM